MTPDESLMPTSELLATSSARTTTAARVRRARVGDVMALVVGLGAGVGATLGTLILALLQIDAPGGLSWVDLPFSLMFGGTFGAVVGGVGAPVVGFTLLRHVPLGVAIAATAAGTLGGAAGGWLLDGRPLIGGCLGFVAAAVLLRLLRRPPATPV